MFVKAKVVKRDTADGVEFLLDKVPIGFGYFADLDSKCVIEWGDLLTGKIMKRDSIRVYGSASKIGNEVGYMPTELFEFEEI